MRGGTRSPTKSEAMGPGEVVGREGWGLGREQSGNGWDGNTQVGQVGARREQEKIRGPEDFGGRSALVQREQGGMSSGPAAFKVGVKLSPSSPKGSPQLTQQKCSGCQWVPKAVTIFCGE